MPPNIDWLAPPDGNVKAIASTIRSIYWDWKSIGNPDDAAAPVGFFLLTSFQSLETFNNSLRLRRSRY
jgi:hypothetical protein